MNTDTVPSTPVVVPASNVGWGHLTDATKESGVKVRLAQVFKLEGQRNTEVMAEMRALTDADSADFSRWFNEAGYPTRAPGAN